MIGVNAQIVSQSGSSSGVGFAIPVNIVKRVVPALIKDGHYNYAWLGISGTSLTLDLNEAMNLSPDQRGTLVIDVTQGGPSDKAGVQGGQNQATINGNQITTGGDVIIAADGQPVTGMDGVIDYLFNIQAARRQDDVDRAAQRAAEGYSSDVGRTAQSVNRS